MKPLDYVLIAAALILLFFAVRYSFRHRKESCDGGCSSCPYAAGCSKKKK